MPSSAKDRRHHVRGRRPRPGMGRRRPTGRKSSARVAASRSTVPDWQSTNRPSGVTTNWPPTFASDGGGVRDRLLGNRLGQRQCLDAARRHALGRGDEPRAVRGQRDERPRPDAAPTGDDRAGLGVYDRHVGPAAATTTDEHPAAYSRRDVVRCDRQRDGPPFGQRRRVEYEQDAGLVSGADDEDRPAVATDGERGPVRDGRAVSRAKSGGVEPQQPGVGAVQDVEPPAVRRQHRAGERAVEGD